MAKNENLNTPGDYQINSEECNNRRMCAMVAPGELLDIALYKGKEVTVVKRQPITEDEKILMDEAVMICPFGAGLFKGESLHPRIKQHAIDTTQDPGLVRKARSNVYNALRKKRVQSNNE